LNEKNVPSQSAYTKIAAYSQTLVFIMYYGTLYKIGCSLLYVNYY